MAIGLIRKQVAAALSQTFAETLDTERRNQSQAGRTEDFRESVAAFAEKRKPIFKGR
jgi:2-(1,2-epoxy-1,2-dihydrophenyl)acetyl-CoA isomerase